MKDQIEDTPDFQSVVGSSLCPLGLNESILTPFRLASLLSVLALVEALSKTPLSPPLCVASATKQCIPWIGWQPMGRSCTRPASSAASAKAPSNWVTLPSTLASSTGKPILLHLCEQATEALIPQRDPLPAEVQTRPRLRLLVGNE